MATTDARLALDMLDLSPDAVVTVDKENTVVFWNSKAEELFGFSRESVLHKPLGAWVPEEGLEQDRRMRERARVSGEKVRFIGDRLHENGNAVMARIVLACLNESRHGVEGYCYFVSAESRPPALPEAPSESALRRAHRLAKLGFWELDGETSEVFWSPELYIMFGLDPSHDQPLTLEEQAKVFTPESWQTIQAAVDRSLRTGEPYEHELEYRSRSGEFRWILARGEARIDGKKKIVGLRGTALDVTQLKATQRELEQSRERLSLAAAAAKFGVWDIDLSTGLLVWDEMMHLHYGTDPDTFGGRFEDWRERVHPADVAAAEGAFRTALEGEEVFDTVFRVCRPNGEIAYLGGKAIVHFRDGKAARVVGINWDVTEQYEAQLTLKASENLLRDFVRHAPAAIAMLDKNLCYLQTSDRWLIDYGIEGEELAGKSHYDVFPDQPVRWREVHQKALSGSVQTCKEDPFPRADGRCDWLQWEVRPWYDAYGEVGGVIFFTQVITERKEMELRLETQRNELQRSNTDLAQFAYAASHDLQEPLRAVSGCAQILSEKYQGQFDDMGDELLQHIVDGAARMKTLISDLLTYSRVNDGEPFSNVDSEQVLEEVLLLLRDAIAESNATILHDELPTVTGNRSQIRQLFQNLIGNAIKYRTDKPPAIQIRVVEESHRYWRFSFTDNGIGIDPKHLSRIFGIFQRLHTRTEYPGTGIGLALCKKIVTHHGGKLWADSALGQGATFSFTIPKGGCQIEDQ